VIVEMETLRDQSAAGLGCVCECQGNCLACRIVEHVAKEFSLSGLQQLAFAIGKGRKAAEDAG